MWSKESFYTNRISRNSLDSEMRMGGWNTLYDSHFFTETMLPSIEEFLLMARPRMRDRGIHLDIDDAKSHNSKISFSKTDEMGFIRVLQPSDSSDLPSVTSFFSDI
jgi:hypothetical protein